MNTQKQLNGKSGVAMAASLFGKLVGGALVPLQIILIALLGIIEPVNTRAATPSLQITSINFSDTNLTTIVSMTVTGGNGGSAAEAVAFNSNQSVVVRGDFALAFPTGTVNGDPVIQVDVGGYPFAAADVNGLSAGGTSVGNAFILDWNPSSQEFTFKAMGGGMNGVVSRMLLSSGKIFFVGDFSSAGGNSNFLDFAIWNIFGSSWDTCTALLYGYGGYMPSQLENRGGGVIRVWLDPTGNAYGGIEDDVYSGTQTIPWTTTWVEWNISGQYWSDWGDDDYP